VTFGPGKFQRAHWADRLAAIDTDIKDMEEELAAGMASSSLKPDGGSDKLEALVKVILSNSVPTAAALPAQFHTPALNVGRGQPLALEASLSGAQVKAPSVILHFRHVNQGEVWQSSEMNGKGVVFRASVPAAYTDSPFPLQYYFEVRDGSHAWLYPGLDVVPKRQPYFVVKVV